MKSFLIKLIMLLIATVFVMVQAQTARTVDVEITKVHGVPVLKIDGKITLIRGVTYHFTRHTHDEWNKALKLMKDAGFNAIRADFAWKDMEPEKGKWNFEEIDAFLNLVYSYGLYVIPTFFYACMDNNFPGWYLDPFRDNSMKNIWGESPWGNFPTPADEQFVRDYCEYVKTVVRHIKDHPAVIAYNPYNEPHFPENDILDYSDYALERFKKWLEDKYNNNIHRLNKRWKTNFRNFEEAELPYTVPRPYSEGVDEPGVREQWEDFRMCMFEVWAHFTDEIVKAIKSVDPKKPVMINEMAWWLWGQMAESCANPVRIFRNADIIGIDIYPGDPVMEGRLPGSIVRFLRDIFPEKLVWICEINSPRGYPSEEEIREWFTSAVEEGASGLLFFEWSDRWESYDGGFYGIADENDEPYEQYYYLKEVYEKLAESFADSWKALNDVKPQIAVIWSERSILHAGREMFVAYDPWGIYHSAFKAGFRVRYYCLEKLKKIPDEPVVLISNLLIVDSHAKEFIRKCLNAGKTLIVSGHFGVWTDDGRNMRFDEERKTYSELFNIEYLGESLGYMDATFFGLKRDVPWMYTGEAFSGGKVLAMWKENAKSACVEVKAGNGTVIVVGTHVFTGTLWKVQTDHIELAISILKYAVDISKH